MNKEPIYVRNNTLKAGKHTTDLQIEGRSSITIKITEKIYSRSGRKSPCILNLGTR
jgi:hypothetical protein